MNLSELLGIKQIHISNSADGFEIDIEFREKKCNDLPILDIQMVKLDELKHSNDSEDKLMTPKH